jgi:hypothetical protein
MPFPWRWDGATISKKLGASEEGGPGSKFAMRGCLVAALPRRAKDHTRLIRLLEGIRESAGQGTRKHSAAVPQDIAGPRKSVAL